MTVACITWKVSKIFRKNNNYLSYVSKFGWLLGSSKKGILHFKHSILPLIIRHMWHQDFLHCVHFKEDTMVRKLELFHFSGEMAGKLGIKYFRLRKMFSSTDRHNSARPHSCSFTRRWEGDQFPKCRFSFRLWDYGRRPDSK